VSANKRMSDTYTRPVLGDLSPNRGHSDARTPQKSSLKHSEPTAALASAGKGIEIESIDDTDYLQTNAHYMVVPTEKHVTPKKRRLSAPSSKDAASEGGRETGADKENWSDPHATLVSMFNNMTAGSSQQLAPRSASSTPVRVKVTAKPSQFAATATATAAASASAFAVYEDGRSDTGEAAAAAVHTPPRHYPVKVVGVGIRTPGSRTPVRAALAMTMATAAMPATPVSRTPKRRSQAMLDESSSPRVTGEAHVSHFTESTSQSRSHVLESPPRERVYLPSSSRDSNSVDRKGGADSRSATPATGRRFFGLESPPRASSASPVMALNPSPGNATAAATAADTANMTAGTSNAAPYVYSSHGQASGPSGIFIDIDALDADPGRETAGDGDGDGEDPMSPKDAYPPDGYSIVSSGSGSGSASGSGRKLSSHLNERTERQLGSLHGAHLNSLGEVEYSSSSSSSRSSSVPEKSSFDAFNIFEASKLHGSTEAEEGSDTEAGGEEEGEGEGEEAEELTLSHRLAAIEAGLAELGLLSPGNTPLSTPQSTPLRTTTATTSSSKSKSKSRAVGARGGRGHSSEPPGNSSNEDEALRRMTPRTKARSVADHDSDVLLAALSPEVFGGAGTVEPQSANTKVGLDMLKRLADAQDLADVLLETVDSSDDELENANADIKAAMQAVKPHRGPIAPSVPNPYKAGIPKPEGKAPRANDSTAPAKGGIAHELSAAATAFPATPLPTRNAAREEQAEQAHSAVPESKVEADAETEAEVADIPVSELSFSAFHRLLTDSRIHAARFLLRAKDKEQMVKTTTLIGQQLDAYRALNQREREAAEAPARDNSAFDVDANVADMDNGTGVFAATMSKALCAVTRKKVRETPIKPARPRSVDEAPPSAADDIDKYINVVAQNICPYSAPLRPLGDQRRGTDSTQKPAKSLLAVSQLSSFQSQLSEWKDKYSPTKENVMGGNENKKNFGVTDGQLAEQGEQGEQGERGEEEEVPAL